MNPYDSEFYALKQQLNNLHTKINELQGKMDNFSKTSEQEIRSRIEGLQVEKIRIERKLADAQATMVVYEARHRSVKQAFDKSKFNVAGWLIRDNLTLLKSVKQASGWIEEGQQALDKCKSLAEDVYRSIQSEELHLSDFLEHAEKRYEILSEIDGLTSEAEAKARKFSAISASKTALDAELAVSLQEIRECEADIAAFTVDIRDAQALVNALSSASTSKQKWEAHAACENRFGESKPSAVVSARHKALESTKRRLKKNQKLAAEIVKRHTIEIESIVIDGSNLCYSQSEFIGLNALVAVANNLSEKYPVQVIFDASIRKKAGMGDDEIRGLFGEKVEVHVMAKGGKADELLLKEAASGLAYVVSCDGFDEFKSQPAVANDRLLRPEITKNKVYISRIGLELAWQTASEV